jgi:hypothetical protein
MAITGNTGGEIRHPEVIAGNEAPSSVGAAGAKFVQIVQYYVVEYSNWIWPILEDLHFIGLILILGAIGVLNLRILGFLKQLPVAPLHRFIPWGIAGVFINVITGILFFIGMPPFYADNPDFQLKMVAIVIAGTNLLLFYCTSAFRPLARLGTRRLTPPCPPNLLPRVPCCSGSRSFSLAAISRLSRFIITNGCEYVGDIEFLQ